VTSNADLTVFVPTRGRPDNMVGFASEFWDKSNPKTTRLIFVLDEDDQFVNKYISRNAGRYEYVIAPPTRRGMVGALNWAYRHFGDNDALGFAVGFLGDDHRPRTDGWDTAYLTTLRDLEHGFVYGNDLFQGATMPTQVAFTTSIADTLGYMSPPELDHLCVDLVWRELGQALGRITYLDKVIVEHMHPLATKADGSKKAKDDKNYKAVNSSLMGRHDAAAYKFYMEEGRFESDVAKLKELINGNRG
jgi:hypothetical protein